MSASGPLRPSGGAIMLDVWAVPGAARTEIRGLHDGALRVRVAAPATDGQANAALLSFLREQLRCQVSLHRGAGQRRKQIRIESPDLDAIAALLGIGNR